MIIVLRFDLAESRGWSSRTASVNFRSVSSHFVLGDTVSHAALALGGAGLACSSVASCAKAVEGALGIGGPAAMICVRGNCEKLAEITFKSAEGLSHLGGSLGESIDCGPACAEMMLQDLGVTLPKETLLEEFGAPMYPETLANALNAHGPEGTSWSALMLSEGADPIAAINYLSSRGPWIAQILQQGWNMGHWIIVDGINSAGNMVVRDPSGVLTELPIRVFQELWQHTVFVAPK